MENIEKAIIELTRRNEDLEDKFDKMVSFLIQAITSTAITLQPMQTNNVRDTKENDTEIKRNFVYYW